MRVGSLFSGIGGMDLGLERAGMRVAWQSETNDHAAAILRKHWPAVPNLGDVKNVRAGVEPVDVVAGGFPCQPFSSASAGRAAGAADDRYLWPEMLRVVQELRPAWVIGENVAHIDRLALEQVVSDLEASGYEVQTLAIPACAVGCDHWRVRYWILGYTDRHSEPGRAEHAEAPRLPWARDDTGSMGKTYGVSARMERLGNAVVPDIVEMIGRAILDASPTERSLRRDASLGCGDSTKVNVKP